MTEHTNAELNQDAIRFYQGLLKRAAVNLKNAKDRNDARAVSNIERKISIYNYTLGKLYETKDILKKIYEAGR